MAMGVWVDEPPFAAELRQALADLMTQARIAAGAKKSYHSKLRRGQPEPTFDLVGGALDSEAMLRLDLACLSILSRKHAECLAQGLDREARWVNGVYYRRADAVTAPMLDEARQLLERMAKAEDRFAQPFDSPATQEKARAALGVIIDRYAELVALVEAIAPGVTETLIQEEAA